MKPYTMNWILLMVLSAVWGGAFTLNKQALETFTPEFIVAGRLIVGSIVLLILVFIIHKRIVITIKQWPYFLFMSLVGIVAPFLLIAYGQKNIDSSLAGILMSTMPISTLILSHFFLDDERMTKTKLVGFIIAFFGIIILIIPEKNLLSENGFNNLSSELMVIGGAIFYSFAAVYGKKFKITDPLNASSGTILFSAIIMFLYLYFFENIDQAYVNNNNIFSVIFLGIFCTAIATIIYFHILQTSGATFVSIMNYLIPIWSIFFGVIFFSENIFWNYLVGLIIVIIGIQIFKNNNLLNKIEK